MVNPLCISGRRLVSTHSRPKAAGPGSQPSFRPSNCFNTQPPEGGWQSRRHSRCRNRGFNTQPPEGGWGCNSCQTFYSNGFNTQPPEGGWWFVYLRGRRFAGFNTQPPEGGWPQRKNHSQHRRKFQHTAARRRLVRAVNRLSDQVIVSTHSRPKAAGFSMLTAKQINQRFNTQPPEGGW